MSNLELFVDGPQAAISASCRRCFHLDSV